MTLSTNARNDYTGNGAVSLYPFTFKIEDADDLRVVRRDTSGAEEVLVRGVDYSVSQGPWRTGGSILLLVDELPTGYHLTIRRVVDMDQATDLRNQAAFFPEVHEDAYDRAAMRDQQLLDALDRAPRLPESLVPGGFDPNLPMPEANAVLMVDPAGTGWTWGTVVETVVGVATSAADTVLTFLQAGVGAVSRTGRAKWRDIVSVKDFGAAGDGATNDAAAFTAAITAHKGVLVPVSSGDYVIGTNVTIPYGYVLRIAEGARISISNGVTLTINGTVSAADVQHIFTGAGSVVFGRSNGWVPVTWFGAAGDGSTNDATAFTNALASHSAVRVPPASGDYIINANISVSSSQSLKFDHRARLSISGGRTFTVNGVVEAPLHQQLFTGAGSVGFTRAATGVSVCWFGAMGADGVTDDAAAIQRALNSACNNQTGDQALGAARTAKVLFPVPSAHYRVGSEVTIPARSLVLEGVNHEGSIIKLTASGATFTIDGTPQTIFRNLFIMGEGANGAGVANVALTITGCEECVLDNVTLYNLADAALVCVGAHILRILGNTRLSVAPVLLRITNTSAVTVHSGNWFQLSGSTAAIELHQTCITLAFDGVWFEGFQNFLLIDNAAESVNMAGLYVDKAHFTSTRTNARLIKVVNSEDANVARCVPAVFRDSTFNVVDTNAYFEVALAGNVDGNSSVSVQLDGVLATLPPTTAAMISDVASSRLALGVGGIVGMTRTAMISGLGRCVGASLSNVNGFGNDLFLHDGVIEWPTSPRHDDLAETRQLDHYHANDTPATPALTGSAGGEPLGYSGRFASFVRDGRRCTWWYSVLITGAGTISGELRITGMPFPVADGLPFVVGPTLFRHMTLPAEPIVSVEGVPNETYLTIVAPDVSGENNDTPLDETALQIGTYIRGSVTYYVRD